jgi:putative transposase
MNKAYKFRIYPTKEQIEYIEKCFNACRYVYNTSLDCEKQLYTLGACSNLSAFGLSYHLKYYKISDPWLKEVDSLALEFEMDNLSSAFKKFFQKGGYPKFKSKKDSKQSFRTRQKISLGENWIKIPKLKTQIECVVHRKVEGVLKQMTISRENGKYFVSIMTEIEKEIPQVTIIKNEVGVDLGVKSFLTLDTGEKIENPKFLSEKATHLAKLQQKLARLKKGSNNHIKLKKKIADLHELISNKRKNFLHEESKKLVDRFDRIYMEDLTVKNMTKSSKGTVENPGKNVKAKSGLNKSILDAGLSMFKAMVGYKAKWSGKELVKIARDFPSSKLCFNCGEKNTELILSDRVWTCSNCNSVNDRDENAAKNIKKEGRKILMATK